MTDVCSKHREITSKEQPGMALEVRAKASGPFCTGTGCQLQFPGSAVPPSPPGSFGDEESTVCPIAPVQLEKTLPAEGQGQVRPQSLVQWPLSLDLAHFPVMTLLMLSWLINYIHSIWSLRASRFQEEKCQFSHIDVSKLLSLAALTLSLLF